MSITDTERLLAKVDVGGVQREVNLACIVGPDHPLAACVGDWVLVHVGFAMSRIDEREAALTLETLAELGELQAETDAMRASGLPDSGHPDHEIAP